MRSSLPSGPDPSPREGLTRALAIALAVLLAAAGGYALHRIRAGQWTDSSLSALVPSDAADPAADRAFTQFTHRLERQVVLVVGHRDRAVAEQAAAYLAGQLAAWPSMARVRGAVSPDQQRAWAAFYAPYRQQFLTPEVRHLLEQHRGDAWQKQVLALVYSPFGGVGADELKADPFLLLRQFLLAQAGLAGSGQLHDGWLVNQDAGGMWHVLVTAELTVDPYGITTARDTLDRFAGLEAQLRTQFSGATLLRQGALFYAGAASTRAEGEVSTIGLISLAGVILLNLFMFRHPVRLGLAILSISGGLVAATAVTLLLTGPLHLFTLVFGASLIGVTEDYSLLYLCHQLDKVANPSGGPMLKRILAAMVMSFGTTVLAYLALLLAPFPVLRQLTLFSVTGLGVAFLIVMLWFPRLVRRVRPRALPGRALAEHWLVGWHRLGPRSRWLPLAALALCAVPFVVTLRANDDVHALQNLDPTLVKEEQQINALFGTGGSTELLLVRAATPEALLQRLELATERLDTARAKGDLERYLSLAAFLSSEQRQRHDDTLVRERLLRPWLKPQLAAVGLDAALANRASAQPFRPLHADEWLRSPVSDGPRELWLDAGAEGVFSVIPLRGVKDSATIAAAVAGLEGVSYVNKAAEVSSQFRVYRLRISAMLAIAAALTYAVLVWRYSWGHGLRIQMPAMVAGLCAAGVLNLSGLPFNLFTVLALLMILGMGIDYTLFFAEARGDQGTTLLAVTLASLSTILSFGLLAFSSTAAIANFGLVVFTGIVVSFLLAPLAGNTHG